MYLIEQQDEALNYRRRHSGLIGVSSKVPIRDRAVLSLVYTPGVAEACRVISEDPLSSFELTSRGNTVAIVTDGSDLFGLAAGLPEAALPLLEAKSVLFKTFAGIDAFPICLDQRDPLSVVETILALTPTFGAICLDHISAPHSFTIADHLEKGSNIPVFSNQHHGSAILVLGALMNALKVVGKQLNEIRVVIGGAGVAGIGIARLLHRVGVRDLVVCDRAGAIYPYRPYRMNWAKAYVAKESNPEHRRGSLAEMLRGADVFIGVSTGDAVTPEMIAEMARDPIVFAMALPTPEISPQEAKAAGAAVVGTGRSDHPNMMDISLVFPGVFRGLLDSGARNIRLRTLVYAAEALAGLVPDDELHADNIVPRIFDFRVAPTLAAAVVRAAKETGEAVHDVEPEEVAENTLRYVYEGMPTARTRPAAPSSAPRPRTLREQAIDLRRRYNGVLEIRSKIPIKDHHILKLLYVPPAALAPVAEVQDNPGVVYDLTVKENLVAIVTDGSAVLGLGDIGPQAALPVMEGKAVLFQSLAGVEAFPICVAERDPQAIVDIVTAIAPSFGGINLEDISAPRCFEIEAALKERLDLPVFHDDQHGTAIIVLAALLNACTLRGTPLEEVKIVINGAGSAGVAVARLLLTVGVGDIILCDRRGIVHRGRQDLNRVKEELARLTNKEQITGTLTEALVGADVFIGVSVAGALTQEMIRSMAPDPIIFALANPEPEILPDEAKEAGAFVVATGRSDYPNQVNNSLAFPGVFRGALDARATDINDAMKLAAARAIADLVSPKELSRDFVIPGALDLHVPAAVAAAVARAAVETGVARIPVDPEEVAARTQELIYERIQR
ncbi:MAG: malic enzyme-like NAD(P)-binding protein [Sphaerobacter thermophilus]|uniref:Malate dehydrogenase (Oxaloacetate-decarboxylating) n=2 Tax=Sphaerobacter TaxID=2056 RepID=D1C9C4_SPHTD|nr:malic enzyme-like NAD(P)-binding protein [Sphaerobacter thermophilus]ACZ40417.1 Malate dehydrogenase (oxaloacetate- decarboxylating) [Sphaerobacter thermophilus DSM 20745]PZN67729.1 MAG: NADP-dependent malic enzyme [Sphaerobacter thermophilus]